MRTTFIVGYPNETEKEFEELCNFIKEVEFDRVGTFTFSVEENTSSFILGDPVPEKEKNLRKETLMEIQKDISLKKNKEFIGCDLEVLIERTEGDYYIGRSYRDAPEVDGEVLILTNKHKLNAGCFHTVKITDCDEYDLYGKLS